MRGRDRCFENSSRPKLLIKQQLIKDKFPTICDARSVITRKKHVRLSRYAICCNVSSSSGEDRYPSECDERENQGGSQGELK